MIVSNNFDGDTCDALAEKLVMLATKDDDLTHREILMAHMGAMCCTLTGISCKDCRLVRGALEEAAKHCGSQPPASGHIH
jgi:hypothetical protein